MMSMATIAFADKWYDSAIKFLKIGRELSEKKDNKQPNKFLETINKKIKGLLPHPFLTILQTRIFFNHLLNYLYH
jgi:hypothetical protein